MCIRDRVLFVQGMLRHFAQVRLQGGFARSEVRAWTTATAKRPQPQDHSQGSGHGQVRWKRRRPRRPRGQMERDQSNDAPVGRTGTTEDFPVCRQAVLNGAMFLFLKLIVVSVLHVQCMGGLRYLDPQRAQRVPLMLSMKHRGF